ncbi:MAG: MerR family transcriptional regulator [Flavobacteriales bacterium]|jgi:MerR family transcriptional regulator, light-induced transcriptional regulator|nr:MerR family transcriptional regulator [Flavobacteriales bacterium]
MGRYSIKQLEQLSGIKSHTIRIWEQRYNLLVPKRTKTNIRFYDDQQLKKLLNVSVLINNGHKISKLSKLNHDGISALITDKLINTVNDDGIETVINELIISMLDYNEDSFDRLFSDSIMRRGFQDTIVHVIYPFLTRVGFMWPINDVSPAQEHFMSNLIRHKLIVAINALNFVPKQDEVAILFLPEGELHEMPLLMAYYLLKSMNIKVVYLGQNVPFTEVVETYNYCSATILLCFITSPATRGKSNQEFLDDYSSSFNSARLYISGSEELLSKVKIPNNVNKLSGIADVVSVI